MQVPDPEVNRKYAIASQLLNYDKRKHTRDLRQISN